LHCILAVSSCCGKDFGIITKGGGPIHFRGEAHSFVYFAGIVKESGAEKSSEKALSLAADDVFGNYWWYAFHTNVCLRGYVNVLFIKQEARQAANRLLLGNGCSYMSNFGHSEVLIKMIDKMPHLLDPRVEFVTLNKFSRKFSVDFPTRENWSTECVDLVAPDEFVFFTDGSLCGGRAD
jgi:hypothetical protein